MTWTVHWPIQRIKATELLSIEISGKQSLIGNEKFLFNRSCYPLQEGERRMECYLDGYIPSFEHQDNLQVLIADIRRSKSRHYTDLPAEGAVPLRSGIKRFISEARKQGLRLDQTQTLHQQAVSIIRSAIL